jgi:peptide chain release factor 1
MAVRLEQYIETSRLRLQEVEYAIAHFDFAATGHAAYQKLNREYQSLQKLVQTWDRRQRAARDLEQNRALLASESDPEFLAVVRAELEAGENAATQLDREIKLLLVPPHPNEGKDVIVEIRPAAGGEEAGLFAGDLFRMYSRYAERKHWQCEILDLVDTPLGGLKGVTFSLRGEDAWGCMHFESGVHRVQRVPVTEASGRIHTSTVTVAVLAEAEDVDLQISPDDLRIDVFRSSGAGGQSVNRTDSAVRVTHLPTGLMVASQQERSQHRNREIAMRLLRSRLLEQLQAQEDARNAAERRSQVGTGERNERIRTYNFPQNRVSDHRFDLTLYDLTRIMEGDLDTLVSEMRARDAERRLAQELGLGQ